MPGPPVFTNDGGRGMGSGKAAAANRLWTRRVREQIARRPVYRRASLPREFGSGVLKRAIVIGGVVTHLTAGTVDTADITNAAVTNAKLSAFQGVRCRASAVSIGITTPTALAYDSEDYDSDGYHDNASNNTRITIPTGLGGKYLLVASVEFAVDTAGTRLVRIRKGGSTTLTSIQIPAATAGYATIVHLSTVTQLDATNYVEVVVEHNASGSLFIGSQEFSASYLR